VFNLVKYRYIFLLLSLVVIVPGFISLVIFQLNVGIDFLGGANMEIRPQQSLTATQLTKILAPLKLKDLQVVPGSNPKLTAGETVWIRLNTQVDSTVSNTIIKDIKNKYSSASVIPRDIPVAPNSKTNYTLIVATGFTSVPKISDIQTLLNKLPNTSAPGSSTTSATATPTPTPKATATTTTSTSSTSATGTIPVKVVDVKQGTVAELLTIQTTTGLQTGDIAPIQALVSQNGGPYLYLDSNSTVGPAVAQQTTLYAITAVLAASAFILLYIWFSFRKLPKAYRYGACAILAMLHDVLVVVGIFSILGKLFAIQIDSLFITALLTVVGFSVHDTIVVFDRVRENLLRRTSESFEQVVNASLVQTLARSLNTSLTVLFTLLTLTLFTGAGSVHNFTLALLIGIFSGTYSSIFNASMLLVMWEKGEIGFNYLGGGDERETRRDVREREMARVRG
jgi:preprotein translocase SecF subunit